MIKIDWDKAPAWANAAMRTLQGELVFSESFGGEPCRAASASNPQDYFQAKFGPESSWVLADLRVNPAREKCDCGECAKKHDAEKARATIEPAQESWREAEQRPEVQEAWNGKGLPPVGTCCIVEPHNTLWGFPAVREFTCVVLAYNSDFVWLQTGSEKGPLTTRFDKVDFRKIRTAEQIAADEIRSCASNAR